MARRTLVRDGAAIKVQPKVFDLLVFLIENRSRAVSKEEIQDAIWADLEVTETALTRAVMKARKLIEDQGDIIKTVHGHGYHFVAEVTQADTAPEASHATRYPRSWFAPIMAIVLLASIGVAALYVLDNPEKTQTRVAVLPIKDQTNDPEMAWVSMGLMSLMTQMIKAENTVATVPSTDTSIVDVEAIPEDLDLPETLVVEIKKTLDSNHLIVSRLHKNAAAQFVLDYKQYHPNGVAPIERLTGDNPTWLVQQMTKNIMATLPGKATAQPYRVISDDVFTNEFYSRGMAFQIQGDAKKARDYFKLAAEEDPSLFWPRYELALTTRKLGLHEEAREALLQLRDERPNLTNDPAAEVALFNALGQIDSIMGEHALALENYQKGYDAAVKNQSFHHQVITASNVGMSYKRLGDYEKARSWIARSIDIGKKNALQANGYSVYQLGQIERDSGDNEKALQLFEEAVTLFREKDQLRSVAAVLSAMARIYGRQGYWKKGHALLDESLILKEQLSDPLGVVDGHLSRTQFYIGEGRYQEAQSLITKTHDSITALNNNSRMRYLQRSEIMLMYRQGQYNALRTVLKGVEPRVFNTRIKGIDLKLKYMSGETQEVETWIQQYQEEEAENSLIRQLVYWDLQAFMAEQNNNPALMDYLAKKVTLSRQMGLYADMAESYLQMADYHMRNEQWTEVGAIIDKLSLYPFEWWQIDLLKAQFARSEGRSVDAKTLAQQAQQNATEAWSSRHQDILDSVMNQ